MAFSRRLAISLALVTSSIAASAAANASQSTHAEVRTIVVRSVSTKVTVAKDTPPLQVFNTGDVLGVTDVLENVSRQFGRPAGAAVGSDRGSARQLADGTMRYTGTAVLPGGTVSISGVLGNAQSRLDVTGGTGAYQGVRGSVIVGDGMTPLNTYRLIFPIAA